MGLRKTCRFKIIHLIIVIEMPGAEVVLLNQDTNMEGEEIATTWQRGNLEKCLFIVIKILWFVWVFTGSGALEIMKLFDKGFLK